MGRTSKAMVARIAEMYKETPNYKKVANQLGINEKTVKKYADKETATSIQNNPGALEIENIDFKSKFSQTVQMLETGRSMIEIVSEYGLEPHEAANYFEQYARIKNLDFLLQESKKDPFLVEKTAELLQLLLKERFSPADFVEEIKSLASIKQARIELNCLQANIKEERISVEEILQQKSEASEELSKAAFALLFKKRALQEFEGRLERVKKEHESLVTRCREAKFELMKIKAKTRMLKDYRSEIIQTARETALSEAQAILADDKRLVDKTINALVSCLMENSRIPVLLSAMIASRLDSATIAQSLEPLAQNMLSKIVKTSQEKRQTLRPARHSLHAQDSDFAGTL